MKNQAFFLIVFPKQNTSLLKYSLFRNKMKCQALRETFDSVRVEFPFVFGVIKNEFKSYLKSMLPS